MWLLGATVLAACLPMVLSSPSCVLFCDTQANASSCIRGCQLGNTSLSACTLCRDVDCTNGCHQAFYCRSCTTLCSLIGGEFSCVNPAADTTGSSPDQGVIIIIVVVCSLLALLTVASILYACNKERRKKQTEQRMQKVLMRRELFRVAETRLLDLESRRFAARAHAKLHADNSPRESSTDSLPVVHRSVAPPLPARPARPVIEELDTVYARLDLAPQSAEVRKQEQFVTYATVDPKLTAALCDAMGNNSARPSLSRVTRHNKPTEHPLAAAAPGVALSPDDVWFHGAISSLRADELLVTIGMNLPLDRRAGLFLVRSVPGAPPTECLELCVLDGWNVMHIKFATVAAAIDHFSKNSSPLLPIKLTMPCIPVPDH